MAGSVGDGKTKAPTAVSGAERAARQRELTNRLRDLGLFVDEVPGETPLSVPA